MASSSTIYTIGAGDVGKTVYDLTFEGATANPPGYLDEDHIFMWINDVQVTVGGGSAEYGGSGVTFVFTTDTQVTVTGYAGILTDKVEFRRTMPIEKPIINFVDGAGLTESDLDKLALENLYRVHEIQDGFGTGTQNYYALAKLYANGDENYEVETGQYSSKHFSIKAAASAASIAADAAATAANVVLTNADVVSTNADAVSTAADAVATAADLVQTNLDTIATAADRVQTGLDVVATGADLALTNADVLLTNADVVSTNADVVLTNADVVSTGLDVVATNADAAATALDVIATNADVVSTNADVVSAAASEAKAEEWAEKAEDVQVEAGKYSALHHAAKAESFAITAGGTGEIRLLPIATPPTGYLECNGATISRTTYANLFSVIGTAYGAGNGSTTFTIPDFRGRFARGWAHGSTRDPDRGSRGNRGDGTTGDNVGTTQADQYAWHAHSGGLNANFTYGSGSYVKGAAVNYSQLSGYAGGNETRPENINVMYCIKY